ncbi:hypothetical protein [Tateyamaria pelophila]|uniref:hypothetical protein n=1 Tax=Tateyamaria pelophila TaxID=328415 RepID=UPI001CBB6B45|nr:hypothetical protein [Tateyamaria pelophila]
MQLNWTEKYWDALEQLYWTPKYLGLKSIPRRHWEATGDRVSVPVSMTNPTGPLYRRVTTGREFTKLVRRHEETFNHIFELTFGILDGEITNDIFCRLLGYHVKDSLKSYGRELGPEFGQPKLYDICQPDGFFTGKNWSLGVELKFDAKTSLDQLAKYLLALAIEREMMGKMKPVALVYIAPNPNSLFQDAFPFSADEVGSGNLDEILAGANRSVRKPLSEIETAAASVLDDLTLRAFSWSDFDKSLQHVSSNFFSDKPESRTVARLIPGQSRLEI